MRMKTSKWMTTRGWRLIDLRRSLERSSSWGVYQEVDEMGLLAGVVVAFAWLLAHMSSAYYLRSCNTSAFQFGLKKNDIYFNMISQVISNSSYD